MTYTLQNRVTVLDREAKELAERVANEQLKCRKMESEVKEERAKRETIRRQMDGYKMQVQRRVRVFVRLLEIALRILLDSSSSSYIRLQAGNVQKVHEQSELMKKKLDECKTIEKVLKDSTNQVGENRMYRLSQM